MCEDQACEFLHKCISPVAGVLNMAITQTKLAIFFWTLQLIMPLWQIPKLDDENYFDWAKLMEESHMALLIRGGITIYVYV
jgi:hypothetical protein